MKHIAFLTILFSCSHGVAVYSPDAVSPDAAVYVDAAPQPRGCDMGNLPNSRTINVDDSDPVPSGLLDEIQDNLIAGSFKEQTLNIGGEDFCIDLGAPTRLGSLWTFRTRGINGNPFTVPNDASWDRLIAPLPLPVGVRVTSIAWSAHVHNDNLRIVVFKRSIGDGGVTFIALPPGVVVAGQTYFGGPGGSFYSGGSSWFLHVLPDAFTPTVIPIEAGFNYIIGAETWGTTGTPAEFDGVEIKYDRQP